MNTCALAAETFEEVALGIHCGVRVIENKMFGDKLLVKNSKDEILSDQIKLCDNLSIQNEL